MFFLVAKSNMEPSISVSYHGLSNSTNLLSFVFSLLKMSTFKLELSERSLTLENFQSFLYQISLVYFSIYTSMPDTVLENHLSRYCFIFKNYLHVLIIHNNGFHRVGFSNTYGAFCSSSPPLL